MHARTTVDTDRRRSLGRPLTIALALVALAVPAIAGAHATISAMQPQGASKAGSRQAYVLRVPNEKAVANTFLVSVFPPAEVQEGISFKRVPGWSVKLYTRDTGKKTAEGEPVLATYRITYRALTADAEIPPKFYEEFPVRFQNPVAGTYCFPMVQAYRPLNPGDKPTLVEWTGGAGSDKPASCLTVTP